MQMNPQRGRGIIAATGWSEVALGSLNLSVENAVVDSLMGYKPIYEESGDTVIYPVPYQGIPIKRKRYLYFRAMASANGKIHEVLVRRAEVPPYPGLVELYASESLMGFFGLDEGGSLTVEVLVQAS
jgi:hypothetical protein